MSSLHVPAKNRHWVFETLTQLMRRPKEIEGLRLELKGPTEGASIIWREREPVCSNQPPG